MTVPAGWLPDPTDSYEVRYWNGSTWTEHVAGAGSQGIDPPPPDLPAPTESERTAPPPPFQAAATDETNGSAAASAGGKLSWKDRLRQAAKLAEVQGKVLAEKGKVMAEQGKAAATEQQARRAQQWAEDPATLWFGESKNLAGSATGMSKARYRITKDRVWMDTGLLGVRSEQVPLWAVKDIDVRQSVMQRGKDLGDVVLRLEDPQYGVDPTGSFSMAGHSEPGLTSGEAVLDDIEHPYDVRELLLPLISEARQKKLVERQTQYLHVNPGMQMAAGMAAAPAASPPATGPAPAARDLPEELRKLAALRADGLLTDEEFADQKARLLAG